MGLYRRQLTGKGGWVGTNLYANGTWSAATVTAAALVGATVEQRAPRDKPRNALTNQYVAKDGRWFSLVINRERRWPDFCRAIGKPEFLDDPRFQETTRRVNAVALSQELDALFATQDWPYWRDIFVSIGVAAGPINRVADVLEDEQAAHAGLFVPTDNPQVPRTVANPLRFGFAVQPSAACARSSANTPMRSCARRDLRQARSRPCARTARWADAGLVAARRLQHGPCIAVVTRPRDEIIGRTRISRAPYSSRPPANVSRMIVSGFFSACAARWNAPPLHPSHRARSARSRRRARHGHCRRRTAGAARGDGLAVP